MNDRQAKVGREFTFTSTLKDSQFVFHSTWGLFSPKGIDDGSRLLIDHLEVGAEDLSLDVGCGYGPIGLAIARQSPRGRVHLVDKDFVAVEYARRNAEANGLENAEAYLSNGLSHVPADLRFDTIVGNLPAKVGNEMLSMILEDAYTRLRPDGQFAVVTINALRDHMKRRMKDLFGNYKKVKQGKTYTVSLARR